MTVNNNTQGSHLSLGREMKEGSTTPLAQPKLSPLVPAQLSF